MSRDRVIIALHGFTGTPQRMRRRSGLDAVAERLGARIAYLRGHYGTWPFWQDSSQTWYRDVIEEIRDQFTMHSEPRMTAGGIVWVQPHVALIGFSAGAYMAIRAGVELRGEPALEHIVSYAGGIEAWRHVGSFAGRLPAATFLTNAADGAVDPSNASHLAEAWGPFAPTADARVVPDGDRHDWFPGANDIIIERLRGQWDAADQRPVA